MTKKRSIKKVTYWVICILFALIIFMAGYHFWNDSQSATTDTTNNANSTSSSGSGGNNNNNPAQEIQKHLSHIGL